MGWRRLAPAIVALALAVTAPGAAFAQGCAMCATALGGPEDPLGRGMYVSILFMVSMPFLLVGSVGGWFLFMYRRGRPHRPALRVIRTQEEGTL